MATFTFVEFQNRDTGVTRMTVRKCGFGGRASRHIDAWRRRNPMMDIIAIYEVEKDTLTEAREWLDWVIYGDDPNA